MPNYRRDYSGTVWFFTVVTHKRRRLFLDPHARATLRAALRQCQTNFPFAVDAWVLLPEHMHCIWTLPEQDTNYSRRWNIIKGGFTRAYRMVAARGEKFWQNRFWAHRIDDESDFRAHMDYVHFNPVKHGLVAHPMEWPWSTLSRCVARGLYPARWGDHVELPDSAGRE